MTSSTLVRSASPVRGGHTQHTAGPQLYVITTHKVRDRDGMPPFGWVPYGMQHAWQAGDQRTLCGEWSSGWTVFWDRAFSAISGTACQGCIEASLPAESRRRLDPPSTR